MKLHNRTAYERLANSFTQLELLQKWKQLSGFKFVYHISGDVRSFEIDSFSHVTFTSELKSCSCGERILESHSLPVSHYNSLKQHISTFSIKVSHYITAFRHNVTSIFILFWHHYSFCFHKGRLGHSRIVTAQPLLLIQQFKEQKNVSWCWDV